MLYGCIQGLILSFIVIRRQGERRSGTYLAIVLFSFSMNLLYYFAFDVGLFNLFPFLKSFYLPWAMLSAISFYLYVTFSAPFQKKLTLMNKFGFLPFIIFGGLHIVIRCFHAIKGENYLLSKDGLSFFYGLEELVGIFYSILLGLMAYKKINQIEHELRSQVANYNEAKLKFHKNLLILALIYCIAWLVLYTISVTYDINGLYIYYLLWLFLAITIHWIAWSGFIKSSDLVYGFVKSKNDENSSIDSEDKTISINENNIYYKKLINLLEDERVYLDEHLSLSSLAKKVGISNSYLSLIINQHTNSNFYNFINSYRVNHFVSLIKLPENHQYTIISLALQSGFNSKSTFQSSFKKQTGKTPSQFIKDLKNESE